MRNLKVLLVVKMAFGRLSNKGCWHVNNPVQKNDSGFLLDFEAAEDFKENAMVDRIRDEGAGFVFSLKGFCWLTAPKLK